MSAKQHHVAAIAVVDLARELKRYSIIDSAQVRRIDRQLEGHVADLEAGRDMSGLTEQRYPEAWLVALWQLAAADARHTDVGARIGITISPEAHGLIANLVLHCENMQEVLDTYLANVGLVNAAESWQVDKADGRFEMVFGFTSRYTYPQCAVERSMVALYYWARYISTADIPILSAEFAFPAPAHADYLQSLFPCDIAYGSDRNALSFSDVLLTWPLPRRNRYVKNILEQRIADTELVGVARSVESRVRELLARDMTTYHRVDQLAQALCMSRVTLYRKLREEGARFSTILDEERRALAQRHRHESITALCDALGFRDASAYYKARRRWEST